MIVNGENIMPNIGLEQNWASNALEHANALSHIFIDVDELRNISTIAVESAQKMDEANANISTVVSQHDWKCPERVGIDEALETVKSNVQELSVSFTEFASKVTEIANHWTDFINNKTQMDNTYMQDIAAFLSATQGGAIVGHSHGGNIASVVTSLESQSLDTANIASLHGSSFGASIVDFSSISDNK